MGDVVIKAENIGKYYIIDHQVHGQYMTLKEVMTQKAKSMMRPGKAQNAQDSEKEEFWAVRDVSFDIKKGERVGIIGRNGAGKSTLLKILARITEPSKGRLSIKGRIASLLEVGTGFHPDLTGRENIFLNGAILGMSRQEIRAKFDQIVAFSEVEKFLDTPVKRYSSGMYVRLAFAIAAHLEPEILVIDEVLAVGDIQFQKKCLGKMKDVAGEGRTVLFVSHNMNAIEQLCDTCIMLEKGIIKMHTKDVNAAIKKYMFNEGEAKASEWLNPGSDFQNAWFKPLRFAITDKDGKTLPMPVGNNSDFYATIEGEVAEMDSALTVGYALYNEEGTSVYWSYHTDGAESQWPRLKKGKCVLRGKIPARFLNEGTYRLECMGSLHYRSWLFEPGVRAPSIFLTIRGGLSDSPYWMARRPGMVAPHINWTAE